MSIAPWITLALAVLAAAYGYGILNDKVKKLEDGQAHDVKVRDENARLILKIAGDIEVIRNDISWMKQIRALPHTNE